MTAREYLQQAYRLDQRINSDAEELERLKEMSASIASPFFGERVQRTRNTDAPFVRYIDKIIEQEERISRELALYVDLKNEIRAAINEVEDTDEQLVLRYRYIHNYTWEKIGDELHADARTVRRWHNKALVHFRVPENPIKI